MGEGLKPWHIGLKLPVMAPMDPMTSYKGNYPNFFNQPCFIFCWLRWHLSNYALSKSSISIAALILLTPSGEQVRGRQVH